VFAVNMPDLTSWMPYKDLICKLYVEEKKSQEELRQLLSQDPYNLKATLVPRMVALSEVHTVAHISNSKAEFEKILRDLKISKNLTETNWLAIKYHTWDRQGEGKETDVYLHNVLIPAKRVRKELRRYGKKGKEDESHMRQGNGGLKPK
jgi:hypothetical protein